MPIVSDILSDWVEHLVKEYGFDGLRIDTVPYVKKSFWRKVDRYLFVCVPLLLSSAHMCIHSLISYPPLPFASSVL